MENKDDFNMTMNWNRSNPWMEYGEFKYPLTCCAMDEKFNIHSKVFNRVLTCAIHGYDIYEMVRKDFQLNKSKIFFSCHLELLSKIN